MHFLSSLFALTFICLGAFGKEAVYRGSTPADHDVRDFLGIAVSDSIDFIRWKLVMRSGGYDLDCQYGISKGGTNGFIDEKKVSFSGLLSKQGDYFQLAHGNKQFYLLNINSSLLYLLDKNKAMLVGNGGYSYVLNNIRPVKSAQFRHPLKETPAERLIAFQGRTPCQELAALLGRKTSAACDKMKWYIIFFTDSTTGQPTHYLEGGRGYKKESMAKGQWEIIRKDGRVIYKLDIDKRPYSLYLLKADENILFFTDPKGHLLVGNEHFSYALNRTVDREPELNR